MGKLTETLTLAQQRAKAIDLPYEGALTAHEAFDVLRLAPGAKLVDVRTRAEWDWVGRIPGAVEIEWDGDGVAREACLGADEQACFLAAVGRLRPPQPWSLRLKLTRGDGPFDDP